MAVSVENTSELGRRLKISVPDATVQEQIKSKMAQISREAHLKGFRPGKVPQSVIAKKFGKSIREEVIHNLIREFLGEALEENKLQPAGTPNVNEINEKDGLEFTVDLEIYPTINLASLSDVEIEKRVADITEKDVQAMVEKMQDQLADWPAVERAIQSGDKLTVDFARVLKGLPIPRKEEQQDVQLIVADKGVLPGLSEALIGKSKGEIIEVDLQYPQDWADDAVAGKELTLEVTIKGVFEKHSLTLEELAKKIKVEPFDLKALQDKVREQMIKEMEQVLQDEMKEKVLEKFLEMNPILLPKSLIEQEKKAIQKEMARSKQANALSEQLNEEEVDTAAKRRVELGLLLNEVISANEIKVEGKRVRAEIEKLASRFPNAEKIVELYYKNQELLANVERMVLLEQAVEAILKQMKVKEVKASFEEVMLKENQ